MNSFSCYKAGKDICKASNKSVNLKVNFEVIRILNGYINNNEVELSYASLEVIFDSFNINMPNELKDYQNANYNDYVRDFVKGMSFDFKQ